MLGTAAEGGYKAGGAQRDALWVCSALPPQPFPQPPMQGGCKALSGHPSPSCIASAPSGTPAPQGGGRALWALASITPAGPQGSRTHQMLLLSQ